MDDVEPTGDRTWRSDIELLQADLARERFARRAIDQALMDAITERDFAEAEFARENRRAVDLKIERDRLQHALADVYFYLGPPQPAGHEVDYEGVPRLVEQAMADRDRLRVVVDDLRVMAEGIADTNEDASSYEEGNAAAWAYVLRAVRQLDGSPTMGAEHDHVVDRNAIEAAGRCPDCGNPDRYCDCPDRTPAMGDVSDSLKRGIADAAADRVKSYGDFTRYVDDEPETPDTGTEPVTLLDGTPVPEPHASKIRRIARQLSAAFYVCPDHNATGGYESCCECGGWTDDDPDRGRMCTEASE